MNKDKLWRWIERGITIVVFLAGLGLFKWMDQSYRRELELAKEREKVLIEVLQKNQDTIIEKIDKNDEKWETQNGINSRVITAIDIILSD